MCRRSGEAWEHASRTSWNRSALRSGRARKNRAPVGGEPAPETSHHSQTGWDHPYGLDAACGEAPAAHGSSATAAFVLTAHPPRAWVLGRPGPLEAHAPGGLQLRKSLRIFWVGLGRGT
jgi:hypothetical protein